MVADDIFKCIFMNEKFCKSIRISLKFIPKGLIDNIGSSNGLAARRRQAITWSNADPVSWCTYVALGEDESTYLPLKNWQQSYW